MDKEIAVIFNYMKAFGLVGVDFIAAFLVVRLCHTRVPRLFSKFSRQIYLIIGAGFLLVAGIGKMAWQFESVGGQLFSDKLNNWIFIGLSIIGTFLLFVDLCYGLMKRKMK